MWLRRGAAALSTRMAWSMSALGEGDSCGGEGVVRRRYWLRAQAAAQARTGGAGRARGRGGGLE